MVGTRKKSLRGAAVEVWNTKPRRMHAYGVHDDDAKTAIRICVHTRRSKVGEEHGSRGTRWEKNTKETRTGEERRKKVKVSLSNSKKPAHGSTFIRKPHAVRIERHIYMLGSLERYVRGLVSICDQPRITACQEPGILPL